MSADAAGTLRRLVHEARFASLGTREPDGAPYVSLVSIAPDEEGAPILLVSDLARHTANLKRDPRASLLIADARAADPLNGARVSLLGTVAPAEGGPARERFLAYHPEAEGYSRFADFAFFRLEPDEAHLVEGFGRIATRPGADLLIDWTEAEALRAAQGDIVSHMNADHADAVALYGERLLHAGAGDWRLLSLDPLGCNLKLHTQVRRLDFPQRITNVAAARQVLIDLVKAARE